MESRWKHLKQRAISLRKNARSITDIESKLGIPRSTLSGWFQDVELTERQKLRLRAGRDMALGRARKQASKHHMHAKQIRIDAIKSQVRRDTANRRPDKFTTEVALAMLYLGEGAKTQRGLGLSSSNPDILRFYTHSLFYLYNLSSNKLRAGLHLRADQNEHELKRYWSKKIGIPTDRFTYVIKDKRTAGQATYPSYRGVCSITGGGVEIQRRLMYLAEVLCKEDLRG